MINQKIELIYVDLFCGAGGTTIGITQAKIENEPIAKVIACVNHDPLAIKSHWVNHPDVLHFEEDIRTLDLTDLIKCVEVAKIIYPNAKLCLWASLECTNFSKAKGGQPRDADSRTLADHLHRYISAINPDYIQIENVVEFMSWGPLDENGKPISKKNGSEWMRWRNEIKDHGYIDDWKELNSADFGALTSRNRLFGIFAKPELPIVWPDATHSKKPQTNSLFSTLEKWKAVKEALHLDDEGISVFNRKKPLSTKTMQRLFFGCIKHIAGGKQHFISKYYSGKPQHKNISIDGPAGTIKTIDGQALVKATFISKYNSNSPTTGTHSGHSIEEPSPVITTQNRLAKVDAVFLQTYYGNGGTHSIDNPCPTIPTKDRIAQVNLLQYFIDRQFGNDYGKGSSIDNPLGTILHSPKTNLVTAEKNHFLLNPAWGGNSGDIEKPCCVIVARQDKAPLYIITCEFGEIVAPVYEDDCEWAVKLKEFMVLYNISDIKMRMLNVTELLSIQGFPKDYYLAGNQTDKKKFIGNSVVPGVVSHWIVAKVKKLRTIKVAA